MVPFKIKIAIWGHSGSRVTGREVARLTLNTFTVFIYLQIIHLLLQFIVFLFGHESACDVINYSRPNCTLQVVLQENYHSWICMLCFYNVIHRLEIVT